MSGLYKHGLILFVLVVLALSMVACDRQDEPARVAEKFLRAAVANDLADLEETVDPDYQQEVMMSIFLQMGLSAFVGGAQGEYTELKVKTITNDGQRATVHATGKLKVVTLGTQMSVPVDVQIPLIKKQGRWYVTGEGIPQSMATSVASPQLSALSENVAAFTYRGAEFLIPLPPGWEIVLSAPAAVISCTDKQDSILLFEAGRRFDEGLGVDLLIYQRCPYKQDAIQWYENETQPERIGSDVTILERGKTKFGGLDAYHSCAYHPQYPSTNEAVVTYRSIVWNYDGVTLSLSAIAGDEGDKPGKFADEAEKVFRNIQFRPGAGFIPGNIDVATTATFVYEGVEFWIALPTGWLITRKFEGPSTSSTWCSQPHANAEDLFFSDTGAIDPETGVLPSFSIMRLCDYQPNLVELYQDLPTRLPSDVKILGCEWTTFNGLNAIQCSLSGDRPSYPYYGEWVAWNYANMTFELTGGATGDLLAQLHFMIQIVKFAPSTGS